MEPVRIRLLGPLEADVGGRPADLGGPRQRAVLGLLLVAGGEVVSVDRLIDDLWRGEPPPRAIGALQAYVSNLRRALEPSRAPRTAAQVLISAPPGYAVRLADADVDAWEFETLLARAASEPAAVAAATLTAALVLWRGPALGGYAAEAWATAAAARLDELRLVARERLVDTEIRAGRFADAVVRAQGLVGEVPLREEGWRLLALGQYADGRQADALATLRKTRDLLADELGIDPGPSLLALERAVLTQSVEVPEPWAGASPAPSAAPALAAPATRASEFVGREAELAQLMAAGEAARAGTLAFALLGGDAGGGKSALLGQLRSGLESSGWRVALGRCPESAGGSPAWAWAEVLRELAAARDPGQHAAALAPLLADDAAERPSDAVLGRFRLHRAVRQWLGEFSDRPLAILLDDVHRADAETRSLRLSLVEQGLSNRVLVVLAYRPEQSPELDELRAALARCSPVRVRLGGLSEPDAAALIEVVTGAAPDPQVAAALATRTDGNPFYLTESARLLASEGEVVATSQVPEGVSDVLRRRFARLPEETVSVLRLAAVIGRDVDVTLLVRAAEVDEDVVLDALESGLISGLLVEPGPGTVRCSHLLVRETLYGGVSQLRRTRWHARVADAVAELYPNDLSALAYHSLQAATAATARQAAERAVAAAELAEGRYAYDAATALYQDARRVLDLVADPPLEGRISALCKLIGAQLRFGATVQATAALKQGVELAEQAGDDRVLVRVLTAWQVPTPWFTRSYGYVDEDLVATILRVLDSVHDPGPHRWRGRREPGAARTHGLVIFEQLAELYATQQCGVALRAVEIPAHDVEDRVQRRDDHDRLAEVVLMGQLPGALEVGGEWPGRRSGAPAALLAHAGHSDGLVARGDLDEARTYAVDLPDLHVDYLWTLFMAIHGLVYAGIGDVERGVECYDRLLPYRGIVAGSGSTGYLFVPMAIGLGRLARMVGRHEDARAHFAEAQRIAEQCGNPYWAALIDADAETPVR